jgi:hypothetical protein
MESSDSENDSDYVPEDPEVIQELEKEKEKLKISDISHRRKRKAETWWDEMQADDRKYITDIMSNAIHSQIITLERPVKRFRRSVKNFISWYKGFSVANLLAETNEEKYKSAAEKSAEEELKQRALESARRVLKKTKVLESRKFAGKEVL